MNTEIAEYEELPQKALENMLPRFRGMITEGHLRVMRRVNSSLSERVVLWTRLKTQSEITLTFVDEIRRGLFDNIHGLEVGIDRVLEYDTASHLVWKIRFFMPPSRLAFS